MLTINHRKPIGNVGVFFCLLMFLSPSAMLMSSLVVNGVVFNCLSEKFYMIKISALGSSSSNLLIIKIFQSVVRISRQWFGFCYSNLSNCASFLSNDKSSASFFRFYKARKKLKLFWRTEARAFGKYYCFKILIKNYFFSIFAIELVFWF